MGLFFDVLSAINNPNQNASIDQLSSITNSVQQLAANHNIDPATMQTVLTGLGGALRPALQQQGGMGSLNQLGDIGAEAGGLGASSLLTPQLQQQIAQGVSQATGMNPSTIQSLLPALLPIVLQLLNLGSSKDGGTLANPLLAAFLGGDGNSNTDLGDVFKFANRFLNPPR